MKFFLICVFTFIQQISGAPVVNCPEACTCENYENDLKVRCPSLDFLHEPISSEQLSSFTTLVVNNADIAKIDPTLKKLTNLKNLSLVGNKIKYANAIHLPKSLKNLDLSTNFINNPPEDLYLLPNLTEINLSKNPISCNCNSIAVRDALLERGVILKKPMVCDSPNNHLGESWFSVKCKDPIEEMLGDAPYEGSGSGESPLIIENESDSNTGKWDSSIENEFIRVSSNSPTEKPTVTSVSELEGSGDGEFMVTSPVTVYEKDQTTTTQTSVLDNDNNYDEDLDYDYESSTVTEPHAVVQTEILPENEPRLKACNFNCSTPTPIEVLNVSDSSPVLGVFEGAKILMGDIFGIQEAKTTMTTTTIQPVSSVTEDMHKTANNDLTQARGINPRDKLDVEEFDGQNKTANFMETSDEPPYTTYMFLGVLVMIIICLVIYAIIMKRSRGNQPEVPQQSNGKDDTVEEVELLNKPAVDTDKTNGICEKSPLMNGSRNGNRREDDVSDEESNRDNVKPLEHGEEYLDLRLKKPAPEDTLIPETKRVTIKAGEIPNSVPKTPIVIIRHMNNDGNIITTLNPNQQAY